MVLAPAYHQSLPYIDPEPTAEELAAARALISAEQAASSPTPALNPEREPSFSAAINTHIDYVSTTPLEERRRNGVIDLTRYEAPELPPSGSDPDALRAVLAKAYVSSAYLGIRADNLQLLDRYGKNAWLLSNYHLEADLRAIEGDLAAAKRDIDAVNAARADRQNYVKGEMQALDDNWKKGVARVLETELAVEELKIQIREELKNQSAQQVS